MTEDSHGLGHLPQAIRERLEGPCDRHPENLAMGCEECAAEERDDERSLAADEALAACVKAIPVRYQEASTDLPQIVSWAQQFHADARHAPSMLLLGPTGTGKTFQAYAALKLAVTAVRANRAGIWLAPRWQALTFTELCASMRPRGRDYDPEGVLKGYLDTDLLVVDDLGAGKVTEAVEEVTYRLVNGRYNDMRPTIFTSNLQLPALRDAIGDRVASRLSETCERVILEGPDRRRQIRAA